MMATYYSDWRSRTLVVSGDTACGDGIEDWTVAYDWSAYSRPSDPKPLPDEPFDLPAPRWAIPEDVRNDGREGGGQRRRGKADAVE